MQVLMSTINLFKDGEFLRMLQRKCWDFLEMGQVLTLMNHLCSGIDDKLISNDLVIKVDSFLKMNTKVVTQVLF